MTNSMFYLPFVLLSFGVGGLKPTAPILKIDNVQTLPVYTQSLVVSGVNKPTSTLFIGGNSYNFDNPIQYSRANLNTQEDIWEIYVELNDTSRIGTEATTINITGQRMYGGSYRDFNMTFPYQNLRSDFFSFGIVLNYQYEEIPPSQTQQYWEIKTISVFNTTPIQWNYEVLDIPSVIFTIFTLPFTFMTKAFDVTIFPGTPFQVNFSNLVMLILGGITFIYIIHFLFKTFR